MQGIKELVEIIKRGQPDVSTDEITVWAEYLQQLEGCHLLSASSPDIDKEAWLLQRKIGIGGSEIAALIEENKWTSPRQIWMSKMGMFDDAPKQQSEPARWGNLLETTVATEWGIRNNRKWIHIPVILQDNEIPWLLANIDGFTLSDDGKTITGILEIKTTSAYNQTYWEDGPLPYNYICQTMWYCGITRLREIELVCLVGGQRLFSHSLPFDEELFIREKDEAKHFWEEYVLKGVEPPATAADKEITKNDEHDESLPPIYLEDDESERLVEAYCQIRDQLSGLEKIKKALYAQIFVLLGRSTQGLTQSHTINLGASARQSCNFDKLKELYPEAYNQCVVTNVTNSLRIK